MKRSVVRLYPLVVLLLTSAFVGASQRSLVIHNEGSLGSLLPVLEVSPSSLNVSGFVTVTFIFHNALRLFAWQVSTVNGSGVNFVNATVPPNEIFGNLSSLGELIVAAKPTWTWVCNCLIGSNNVNGTGILFEALFEVKAPAKINVILNETFFINDHLELISYVLGGS